jgi:hypothetical protein
MMWRPIVTGVLLIFVAATVGKLVLDSFGREEASEAVVETSSASLVATYFHTSVRCWNCNTIERFTHETLLERFADELASGSIEWRVVNIDEAVHDHFVDEFELVSSSVVLVEMARSEGAAWKKLSRVWDLVHDEEEFKTYVEEAVRTLLEGGA